MTIEIQQRRVVPDKPDHNHRGQQASLAVDHEGYRAWGFGETQAKADENAISNLKELRAKK